jgi:oxygen-independent coproporphyrinogen-3 oxidase
VDEARYRDEFLLAHETLTRAGYEHYEVSNYARPGHRSRHNGAYWTGAEYLGVGPSAHSLIEGTRRWNLRHWAAYRAAIGQGRDPVEGSEALTDGQRHLEEIYLGLRTSEGIAEAAVGPGAAEPVRAAVARGWLSQVQGRLRPTPEGWLRLDALVPHLTAGQGTS